MKGHITESEEQLVEDYIYKVYLINILENDLIQIDNLPFKIGEPYKLLIENTLKRLRVEVRDINATFNEVTGKVEGPELVNVDFFEYKYFIRGYQGVRRIFRYHFRNTANRRLEEYFL